MRRKLFIFLFVFVFLLSNITPVFAAQTLELLAQKKNIIDGNIYEITYYSPDSENNIPMIISETESWGTVISYRLTFYNKNTTWSYNTATKAWQASQPFYYKQFSTLDAAIESLFNNQTATDYTQATKFGNFTYGAIIVYSQEEYSDEAASSLEAAFYDWYTTTTGEEPPLKGSSGGGEGGEIEDPGIFEILQAIYEAITHPRDTDFLVDVKEGLITELQNNQFTNGILGITQTILEIFNKDYTKPANFYRDNPFKLEINGIAMPSEGGGYWIDNRFNMNLEPLNEKTMRWYFGDYINLSGTYLMMDGTPAVKSITDSLISAILWLSLGVGLFKNLTRILDGDFASAGITKLKAYREKERNTNKDKKTGKKGE